MQDLKRGRRRRRLLIAGLCLAAGVAVAAAATAVYLDNIDEKVARTDVFGGTTPLPSRPPKVVDTATNVLLLGLDNEDAETTSSVRADTIILVHIPADRSAAQFISIPRDTWLLVPDDGDGHGGTVAKINAAYAWGQTRLMVQTVESFTGVRVDHTVSVDFDGFARVIDALGGIDVTVDQDFTSAQAPYRTYSAGLTHMDGVTALDYARQRKPFADGDFTRMRHQRDILRAVFDSATRLNLFSGPAKLDAFVNAIASSLTVDDTFSLLDLAGTLHELSDAHISMLASPSEGTGMVGDQSVVFPDVTRASELYAAVRNDTMDDWLAQHSAD